MNRAIIVCASLALAGPAMGAFTTVNLDTDADFVNALNNEGLTELWTAQGRIGNAATNGDQEFDIGVSSASPVAQTQFAWADNQPATFTLSYNAGSDLLSFTTPTGVIDLPNAGAANEIFIRVRATNQRPDLAVALETLLIDGMAIPSIATDNITLDGVEYLRISGASLASGFNMTGVARLNFDQGNPPSGSNLAFQIKGTIPTPGSVAVLGLAGLAATRRRRNA